MKKILLPVVITLITFAHRSSAQVSLDVLNTPVLIDFNTTVPGVNNGPFAAPVPIGDVNPVVGQIDQDAWDYYFDGTSVNAETGAANFPGSLPDGHGLLSGGSFLAGVNAVDINGHRALGIQPAGNQWTSGNLSLRVANNTGSDINQLHASYKAYYYNDQPRSNDLRFFYSITDAPGSFVEVASAVVTSPLDPDTSATWVEQIVSTTITGIIVPAGYEIYIRWAGNDVGGAGSRDEFAITDLSFTAQNATVPSLYTNTDVLPPFSQSLGTPSAAQVFDLSGAQLTADVSLTAGAPFEISLDGILFSPSLTVPQVAGTVPPTAIHVRLNSAVVGFFNDTVNTSSASVDPLAVFVSGNTINTIGVDEHNAKPLLCAWPNPMIGNELFLDRSISGTVIDMDGRVITAFINARRIDLSNAFAGIYILHTNDGGRMLVVKQ